MQVPGIDLNACYLLGITSAEDGINGQAVLTTNTTFEVAREESPTGRRCHGWILGVGCQVAGLDTSSNQLG